MSAIADRELPGVIVNKTYRNVALVLLPVRGIQHVQIHKVHLTAHAQNPTRESFAKMKEMHASFLPVKMAEDAK